MLPFFRTEPAGRGFCRGERPLAHPPFRLAAITRFLLPFIRLTTAPDLALLERPPTEVCIGISQIEYVLFTSKGLITIEDQNGGSEVLDRRLDMESNLKFGGGKGVPPTEKSFIIALGSWLVAATCILAGESLALLRALFLSSGLKWWRDLSSRAVTKQFDLTTYLSRVRISRKSGAAFGHLLFPIGPLSLSMLALPARRAPHLVMWISGQETHLLTIGTCFLYNKS